MLRLLSLKEIAGFYLHLNEHSNEWAAVVTCSQQASFIARNDVVTK